MGHIFDADIVEARPGPDDGLHSMLASRLNDIRAYERFLARETDDDGWPMPFYKFLQSSLIARLADLTDQLDFALKIHGTDQLFDLPGDIGPLRLIRDENLDPGRTRALTCLPLLIKPVV